VEHPDVFIARLFCCFPSFFSFLFPHFTARILQCCFFWWLHPEMSLSELLSIWF